MQHLCSSDSIFSQWVIFSLLINQHLQVIKLYQLFLSHKLSWFGVWGTRVKRHSSCDSSILGVVFAPQALISDQLTWPLSSQTAMANAPGSFAPRTDSLGQTTTLAGSFSWPGQRNTLCATSFSTNQFVNLTKNCVRFGLCLLNRIQFHLYKVRWVTSKASTVYLLNCRATAASTFELREGTKRHQPCQQLGWNQFKKIRQHMWQSSTWPGYWSFPQVCIGPARLVRFNPRTAALRNCLVHITSNCGHYSQMNPSLWRGLKAHLWAW